jgi:hypothetical protein
MDGGRAAAAPLLEKCWGGQSFALCGKLKVGVLAFDERLKQILSFN